MAKPRGVGGGEAPAAGASPDRAALASARLRAEFSATGLRVLRPGALAGAAIVVVWGSWWDSTLSGSDTTQVLGRAALAAFMVAMVAASYTRIYLRHYGVVTATGVVVAIAAVTGLLLRLPGGDSFATEAAILSTGIVSTIGRMRAPAMAACALGVLVTHGLQIRAHGLPLEVVLRHMSFLSVMCGYAVFASHRAWRAFLADRLLLAERERAAVLSRELLRSERARLSWLRRFAGFLRHELKNQLVGLDTSLRLAEEDGDAKYLARARRSLELMGRLVSSATEASDLESALASEERERLDLSQLVAEHVRLFTSGDGRPPIETDVAPGCIVMGDELRLVQLLDKLLQNAAEHGRPQGTVRVSLQPAGDRVRLVVENEGDPLPADREAIFEAFVSSKPLARHPEGLGLGLYVVRRIAVLHGGTAHAEPLADPPPPEAARLVVELPAVAASPPRLSLSVPVQTERRAWGNRSSRWVESLVALRSGLARVAQAVVGCAPRREGACASTCGSPSNARPRRGPRDERADDVGRRSTRGRRRNPRRASRRG